MLKDHRFYCFYLLLLHIFRWHWYHLVKKLQEMCDSVLEVLLVVGKGVAIVVSVRPDIREIEPRYVVDVI